MNLSVGEVQWVDVGEKVGSGGGGGGGGGVRGR